MLNVSGTGDAVSTHSRQNQITLSESLLFSNLCHTFFFIVTVVLSSNRCALRGQHTSHCKWRKILEVCKDVSASWVQVQLCCIYISVELRAERPAVRMSGDGMQCREVSVSARLLKTTVYYKVGFMFLTLLGQQLTSIFIISSSLCYFLN